MTRVGVYIDGYSVFYSARIHFGKSAPAESPRTECSRPDGRTNAA